MKLTVTDLEKINTIPSLARLCRTVIEISDCGVRKDYCLDVVESLIPVLKQHCPTLRLVCSGGEQ